MTTVTQLIASPEAALMPQQCTPCQTQLDTKREWGPTIAVLIGDTVMGIRCDTEETARHLGRVLAPVRAPEYDEVASPNISVELGEESGSRRKLFLAYRDHELVARRRDRDLLVEDLLYMLDEFPRAQVTDTVVVLGSAVITDQGDAVLLPALVNRNLISRRKELDRMGLRLLTSRAHPVDLATGELVVDAVQEQQLAQAWARHGGPAPEPRRVPLHTWCVPMLGEHWVQLRPVDAVFSGVGTVLNRQALDMGDLLASLGALAQRIRFVGMPVVTAGAQVRMVAELLD